MKHLENPRGSRRFVLRLPLDERREARQSFLWSLSYHPDTLATLTLWQTVSTLQGQLASSGPRGDE